MELTTTYMELLRKKQEIEEQIKIVEQQMIELKLEQQNNCDHLMVNNYKEYDGHTWKSEYRCKNCNKKLNTVNTNQCVYNIY